MGEQSVPPQENGFSESNGVQDMESAEDENIEIEDMTPEGSCSIEGEFHPFNDEVL